MKTRKILYVLVLLIISIFVMGAYTGCTGYFGAQSTLTCQFDGQPLCDLVQGSIVYCEYMPW